MSSYNPPTRRGVSYIVYGFSSGLNAYCLCPRDAKSMGVEFLVGFESEFVLLKSTSPIEPVNQQRWCSAAAFPSGAVETQVLEEVAECLMESGIELQMYHSEGAVGQYEVITGPLPPLQAVDALIHTRDIIFNVASKHGLRATLVPRIYDDGMFNVHSLFKCAIHDQKLTALVGVPKAAAQRIPTSRSTLRTRTSRHQSTPTSLISSLPSSPVCFKTFPALPYLPFLRLYPSNE